MAAITGGIANTFEAPNYVGPLYGISPEDTPFLSMMGGLAMRGGSLGEMTTSTTFQWQEWDLRDPESDRQRLEGADAPAAEGRKRANVTNVVEIHQEAITTTYTRQAAIGQFSGANITGSNPVTDEHTWQVDKALRAKARDIEYTFIRGTFQSPADNSTPRQTRGILAAITTNVTAGGSDSLDDKEVLDTMQDIYDAGGIMETETRVMMVPPVQKRWITSLFISDRGYEEQSRTVGGVAVTRVMTDFGSVNVVVNRWMPTDTIAILSMEEITPVYLLIPGKGFLFVEPLAKTGATYKDQLYGELGLKYGNERKHGKITGLATTAPPVYGS